MQVPQEHSSLSTALMLQVGRSSEFYHIDLIYDIMVIRTALSSKISIIGIAVNLRLGYYGPAK